MDLSENEWQLIQATNPDCSNKKAQRKPKRVDHDGSSQYIMMTSVVITGA